MKDNSLLGVTLNQDFLARYCAKRWNKPDVRRSWLSIYARLVAAFFLWLTFQRTSVFSQTAECPETVKYLVCDDFSDGNARDGMPVSWKVWFGGRGDVVDGSLEIKSGLTAVKVDELELRNTSLRAQVTMPAGDFIGLSARVNDGAPIDNYFAFLGRRMGGIGFGRNDGTEVTLGVRSTNFDVSEEDVVMQFDAIDNQLSFWAWLPEEDMPDEPLVTVTHDALASGEIALWASSRGVFRYVQVSDTHISDVPFLAGDFDGNGMLDSADIDALTAEVIAGAQAITFDLNGDNIVTTEDRRVWVKELKKTYYGDANLDGEFNSQDLVNVFQSGQYEDPLPGDSQWATGDWNGDADFESGDLVIAFQDAGYEKGPRVAVNPVPEPTATVLLVAAALVLGTRGARRAQSWSRDTDGVPIAFHGDRI